jgi:CubicO group peptidase (beta-lactamase class C family)
MQSICPPKLGDSVESDAHLRERAGRGAFSGAVLVRRGETTLLDRGYGYADRQAKVPVRPGTIFQIASISKQFTAAAILLLQEQNRLSVNERLSRWLDQCPESWGAITIHHLLTHTAGVGHWDDYPEVDLYGATDGGLLGKFLQKPLRSPPGKR